SFLSLTQSGGTSPVYGQSLTLTATVTASIVSHLTGTVTFYNGATVIGSATLSTTNGVTSASITTSALPAGSDSLSATYSGNTTVSSSTGSLTLAISKAHLTVASDNQAKTYDGLVFTPFTVHFAGFVNGQTAGTAAITGTPTFSGAAVTAVNA